MWLRSSTDRTSAARPASSRCRQPQDDAVGADLVGYGEDVFGRQTGTQLDGGPPVRDCSVDELIHPRVNLVPVGP